MGTNCAPILADLFYFVMRDFMLSLSDNNQTDIIETCNSTSRYLDDLLNIDNPYFEQMVGQIYPIELQLIMRILLILKLRFLDLNLSITNGIVSSKIYDKRDDFNFAIVNFPFLDGDFPRPPPPPGRGFSHFFDICRLGPSIYHSLKRNIRNFKHPKKLFEILATQKNIPILYLNL